MNGRTILFIGLGVAALVVVLLLARRNRNTLERGLPPRVVCASRAEAERQAGGGAVAVLGTGSMAPYIPAAGAGLDPLATICAYVVLVPGATVADVTEGALCIYVPNWAGRNVMHQAAAFDGGGWIMTGLHNKTYENSERMTGEKFVGLVARTYVWEGN